MRFNTFRQPLRLLLVGVMLIALLPIQPQLLAAGQNGTNSSASARISQAALSSKTIKLVVDNSDQATLATLNQSGSTLLADYGSFSLWRAANDIQLRLSKSSAAAPPDIDTIYLRDSAIQTATNSDPPVPANLRQTMQDGPQLWLVQFVGPIKNEWLDELDGQGLDVVMYMPSNAYVVWGDRAAIQKGQAGKAVQWSGAYHPAYRLEASLIKASQTNKTVQATVQLYNSSNLQQSLTRLQALGGQVLLNPERVLKFTDISLELPADRLVEIANWPDVFNIEPFVAPKMLDEVQDQIVAGNLTVVTGNVVPAAPGYLSWLSAKGFPTTPTSYPLVDVTDDGVDNGSINPLHPDFHELGQASNPSRLLVNSNCTYEPTANGMRGHGNINAGIVGSYNALIGQPHVDKNGYNRGLGVAPYTRLGGLKIFTNGGQFNLNNCGITLSGLVARAYADGAQITSNSWGSNVAGAYDSDAQNFDSLTRDASATTSGNQQMLHVFAAGNSGNMTQTLASPASAKNVLTVGATENVRDEGVPDGCNLSNSDNADDIASFSSRGPTTDGRIKPDIMAPGIHIQGPASQDPGYNGAEVCGDSGFDTSNKYYPTPLHPTGETISQTLYTWSSGTSHSTPAVAGGASLLYNYYGRVLTPGQIPSPAMLKALIVNSSRYLNGNGTGGTLPTNDQGWGDLNLGNIFDGVNCKLVDQSTLLVTTGQTFTQNYLVSDITKPLRVSLVWTDAPGSTTGNAYVNDLDLQVTVNGQTYKGNVFSGQYSIIGGVADGKNNVENVFLPAGVTGTVEVKVTAANLAGVGVPGASAGNNQDFALVAYNVTNPVGCVASQVTIATDNGLGDTCGTLTYALAQNTAQTITFNGAASQGITFTAALSPTIVVGNNVSIDGGANCANPIVINGGGFGGDGLRLVGGAILRNLQVENFGGRSVVATITPGTAANKLICTRVT